MVYLFITLFLTGFNAHAGDTLLAIDAGTDTVGKLAGSQPILNGAAPSTCGEKPDDDEESAVALQEELESMAPVPPDFEIKNAPPLLWEEDDTPENKYWSRYAFRVISSKLEELNHAKDIGTFCPNYKSFSRDQQVIFWGHMFASISYWESSFDPLNITLETMGDKGTDAITHQPLYSCGLLQLSYQDTAHYKPGSCPFDWEKDKLLDEKDIHRTLLNPYTNLYCGINIMAEKITQIGKVISQHSYYWATLQRGNLVEDRHGQIGRMIRKAMPECGGNKVIDSVISHSADPILEFIRDHI